MEVLLVYHSGMLPLRQLAAALQVQCHSCPEDCVIARAASISRADAQSIVFAEHEEALHDALRSPAAAIFTTPQLAEAVRSAQKPLLAVAQPRLAFAHAARLLHPAWATGGIHPTAVLGADCEIAGNVSIGAYTVLGDGVRIGASTRIAAGSVIADGVEIGANCHLYPRVVIYSGVTVGNRVVIHAGCVLGSDGFGYVRNLDTGAYVQFPQQGTLVVEDDVEIGANTTIDRGALEETRIARGAKLDNLVHIGHNVRIGADVVIAAQTGISGSSTVMHGAILGGQVGIGEHAEVGPDVILGGGTGVLSKKKLRGPGVVFWGRPAQPLRQYLKGLAMLARLARKAKD